jgi:hypothetical protein
MKNNFMQNNLQLFYSSFELCMGKRILIEKLRKIMEQGQKKITPN